MNRCAPDSVAPRNCASEAEVDIEEQLFESLPEATSLTNVPMRLVRCFWEGASTMPKGKLLVLAAVAALFVSAYASTAGAQAFFPFFKPFGGFFGGVIQVGSPSQPVFCGPFCRLRTCAAGVFRCL